jgi:hypothetical protein
VASVTTATRRSDSYSGAKVESSWFQTKYEIIESKKYVSIGSKKYVNHWFKNMYWFQKYESLMKKIEPQ